MSKTKLYSSCTPLLVGLQFKTSVKLKKGNQGLNSETAETCLVSIDPSLLSPHVDASLCPALPDVPPSSYSILTSSSFPSLPFTFRSPLVYPSSFFPRVSKFTQPYIWLLDSLLNMRPIYLQHLSRMVLRAWCW